MFLLELGLLMVCVRALEKGPMRRPEGLAVIELIQSQEYSGLTD